MSFDPNSVDSVLSMILTRLDAMDKRLISQDSVLLAIKEQTTRTNGRVNLLDSAELPTRVEKLEKTKTLLRGNWAAIVVVVMLVGWAVQTYSYFKK